MSENKSNMGRPRSLTDADKKKIVRLAKYGFTDDQIADVFGITKKTLQNYKKGDPEFLHRLKASKTEADADIVESLYNKAKGMTIKEQKAIQVSDGVQNGAHIEIVEVEKELPPDTGAMTFWLKNRQPEQWRDKIDVQNSGEIEIKLPDAKLANL